MNLVTRSTSEVFDHHINSINQVDLDELALDYAEDAFLITKEEGVIRGKGGILTWFRDIVVPGPLAGATFEPTTLIVEADVVYLEWEAVGATHRGVGVDHFVIHAGLIRAQTVKVFRVTRVV